MASRWCAAWLTLACVVAALALWLVLPSAQVLALMDEHGPVEVLSAGGYLLAAAAIWLGHERAHRATALALGWVLLAMFARELDWHKAATGSSVLRLSWYAGDAGPLTKLVAGALVLSVVAALAWLAVRHGRAWWAQLRRGVPVAWTVLVFFATLAAAKAVDRAGSVLPQMMGAELGAPHAALRIALEEALEFALALHVLLGWWQQREGAGARR
jgi:hypothetical protein